MEPVIIIGSGLAGYTLAREWRKLDTTTPLVMITQDDGCFYSKPMLSNALAAGKQADELIMASAEKMASDLHARIFAHAEVKAIQREHRKIVTDKGETFTYRTLVLATGARPVLPPVQGSGVGQVLQVNNLEDYRRFRKVLEANCSVAIIGPGLIGCEFANDLVLAGYAVTVIGPDLHPLGRLVPAEVGQALQQALADQGVKWKLASTVERIEESGSGLALTLAGGESLQVDMVLSAIGLKADTRLAQEAGLETGHGIVVDRYLQTRDTHVYALGDCAEVNGKLRPFVLPLMAGARALARTLGDERTAVSYPPMPVVIKTPALPLVVCPPQADTKGQWAVEVETGGLRALYKQNDEIRGFALCGECVKEKASLIAARGMSDE